MHLTLLMSPPWQPQLSINTNMPKSALRLLHIRNAEKHADAVHSWVELGTNDERCLHSADGKLINGNRAFGGHLHDNSPKWTSLWSLGTEE